MVPFPLILGIWWFTKMLNRVIGEERYDAIRIQRRVYSNKFYYFRQQILYRWFIEHPDVANMLGIYPKVDSSHGFGFYSKIVLTQTLMKCTGTSNKTPSTVTAPSVCGSSSSASDISCTNYTITSGHGTGTKQHPAKMEKRKGSE